MAEVKVVENGNNNNNENLPKPNLIQTWCCMPDAERKQYACPAKHCGICSCSTLGENVVGFICSPSFRFYSLFCQVILRVGDFIMYQCIHQEFMMGDIGKKVNCNRKLFLQGVLFSGHKLCH